MVLKALRIANVILEILLQVLVAVRELREILLLGQGRLVDALPELDLHMHALRRGGGGARDEVRVRDGGGRRRVHHVRGDAQVGGALRGPASKGGGASFRGPGMKEEQRGRGGGRRCLLSSEYGTH